MLRRVNAGASTSFHFLDPAGALGEPLWTEHDGGGEQNGWDVSPAGDRLVLVGPGQQHPELHLVAFGFGAMQVVAVYGHAPVWRCAGGGWPGLVCDNADGDRQ